MRSRFYEKGQSTLEYALLIAVIVAGLIAMQVYMKRGVQGKLRSSTDSIGEQYSPGYTTSEYTTTQTTTSRETLGIEGAGITYSDASTTQGRTGKEEVSEFDKEYWPE